VCSYTLSGVASEFAVALPIVLTAGIFGAYLAFPLASLAAFPQLRRVVDVEVTDTAERRESGESPGGTPLRFPAWVGVFAAYVTSGMIATVFPLFAADELRISKGWSGP
jgi:hypothetical protein